MKSIYQALILLSTCLILSACNLGAEAPQDPSLVSTAAAQTVEALLTSAADSAVTQTAVVEVLATQTSAPACEDSATNTAWERDHALYDVKSVNTLLAPEQTFVMSWTFMNTGTCTWDNAYRMFFETGTLMTKSANFAIVDVGQTVPPGQTVTVDIAMAAPAQAGEYQASWQLLNKSGEALMNFGVIIKVGSASSSSSLKAPADLQYAYDCSSGAVNVNLMWVDASNDEEGFRIYRDGTKLADIAAGSTSYTDVVPSSGEYDYVIAAFNPSGESTAKLHVSTKNCQ